MYVVALSALRPEVIPPKEGYGSLNPLPSELSRSHQHHFRHPPQRIFQRLHHHLAGKTQRTRPEVGIRLLRNGHRAVPKQIFYLVNINIRVDQK